MQSLTDASPVDSSTNRQISAIVVRDQFLIVKLEYLRAIITPSGALEFGLCVRCVCCVCFYVCACVCYVMCCVCACCVYVC